MKDFAIKICLEIQTCENTFSAIKQVKCKNRNRMAGWTLVSDLLSLTVVLRKER